MDKDESTLRFTFNGTLVNKHFEQILDIISEKIKNEKQIKRNKQIILNLLSESFSGVTSEKLANCFNLILLEVQDVPIKKDTIKDINESINRFSRFILSINDKFKDRGYSTLVSFYFWLTDKY